MFAPGNTAVRNTSYKVVLPFYAYAAISLLVATTLLLLSSEAFTMHYFHPHTLAITHTMALGWGTMIILGAGHQLFPVLIERSLYSERLALASFLLAAIGIPLLVYGFYVFDLTWPARWGGTLVCLSITCFIINLFMSIRGNQQENVHAVFMVTASLWLLMTGLLGLTLVFNFSYSILPADSLRYLPLHAHLGIAGWFLLLVIGVGSRLIPMFLISKYNNPRLLWIIFGLINGGLASFVFGSIYFPGTGWNYFSIALVLVAVLLFGHFCIRAMRERIRRQVDAQVRISMMSVLLMLLPIILLLCLTGWLATGGSNIRMVLIYGFTIFFGWITAIILGMTFKTLPFIVWNKVYHDKAGLGRTPNPKELFSNRIFLIMAMFYLAGFVLFLCGAYLAQRSLLNVAAASLLFAACLYNWNVFRIILHKPARQ